MIVYGRALCSVYKKIIPIWVQNPVAYKLARRTTRAKYSFHTIARFETRTTKASLVAFVSSDARGANCWKCGVATARSSVFCDGCNALQAPEERVNYFGLFGMQEDFDLDPSLLTTEHKRLQWKLHPDKFSQKEEKEQQFSEKHSSVVNDAYWTLSRPLSRAIYLLELRGHPFNGDDLQMDQAFLADMMTLNEQLADFKSEDEVKELARENAAKMDEVHEKLSKAFKSNDSESVKMLLGRLKYYCNIEDKTKEALTDIISKR